MGQVVLNVQVIHIGYGNYVPKNEIVSFLSANSRPIRALISRAKLVDKYVDATNGHKTTTVILCHGGYVILSAVTAKTLAERYRKEEELFS